MVERNLAKVEVESSRLFSRSNLKGSTLNMLPFFIERKVNSFCKMLTVLQLVVGVSVVRNMAR